MGLKSNEREHLLIRQLKLTANEPVTKPALLRTVSRWAHKLISCYNSSVISKYEPHSFYDISYRIERYICTLSIMIDSEGIECTVCIDLYIDRLYCISCITRRLEGSHDDFRHILFRDRI